MVICTGVTEAETAILRSAVRLFAGELESVRLTVNGNVPTAVGVPMICPEPLSVRPVGREPELTDQL